MHNLESLKGLLHSQFGFSQFKPHQEKVLSLMSQGDSGLVVMPTGGGKSLFYQLWSAQPNQFVLVISPLIALMQDQVDQARGFGLRASCLNAHVSREDKEKRLAEVVSGKTQLLFVTPERFRMSEFREALEKRPPTLLAVDEAHCISQWGHDFRPDYSKLGELRQSLGDPQTLALTATATPKVQQEILSQLRIPQGFCEVDAIERPELSLNVHEVMGLDEKIRAVVGLKHQIQGSVLVYGSLISTLYKVAEELSRMNLHPILYHGQMRGNDRKKALREFQEDSNAFLLATPAFGLGIHKENLRAVIHLEIPMALESYFQEVGRAGRDRNPAWGHLLFDPDDLAIQMDFIKWANPDAGFVKTVYQLIENNFSRAASEGVDYLREQMNFYNSRDFRSETSLNLLERWGCLRPARNRLGFEPVMAPSESDLEELRTGVRLKVQNEKLMQMFDWARETDVCRMNRMQRYFGQAPVGVCGVCDVCVGGGI